MTLTKKMDEEDLVKLLQERKESSFNYLYDNYSGALYAVIYKVVNDDETANDLLQEVFVKIWNSVESYDPSKGRLYTWMLNIARNRSIDFLRSKAHNKSKQTNSIDDNVYVVDQHNQTNLNTDTIGVREFVSKLKEKHRDIIELVYFKGYTQEETAEELGIPLGTVKTRSRAAIKELRELLQD